MTFAAVKLVRVQFFAILLIFKKKKKEFLAVSWGFWVSEYNYKNLSKLK